MDDQAEIAAAERLGALVTRLRKSQNLTQRELGRRAGLSWTFIALLEKGVRMDTGRPVTPSPQTLQKLASGLARDGLDPQRKNPGTAAMLYGQLMEARGWASDDSPPAEREVPTVEELGEGLASLAGPEVGAELLNLASAWFQLSPDGRRLALSVIRYVTAREGQAPRRRV